MTIDLVPQKKEKTLNNVKEGGKLREQFKLDELDNSNETVFINVSLKIFSMSYGFFVAMFGDSIRTLGALGFHSKYQFICGNKMQASIQSFTERCINESGR